MATSTLTVRFHSFASSDMVPAKPASLQAKAFLWENREEGDGILAPMSQETANRWAQDLRIGGELLLGHPVLYTVFKVGSEFYSFAALAKRGWTHRFMASLLAQHAA